MNYIKLIACWIIVNSAFLPSKGQPFVLDEHFAICTDRSIYVAGETIRFSIFDLSDRDPVNNLFSSAYYIQLIAPDHHIFASTAIKLSMESGGQGSMQIPSTLPSGNYFIVGYTKWLMNQGPEGFNYLSVTILNPYINERLNHKNKHRELTTISQRSHAEDLPDAIIMKDHAFQKREWVSFFIDPKISRNLNNACLTVVPKGAMKCQYHNENEGRSMPEGKFRYMPELNGMTLSGRVTGKNNASVSYARVYFTSLGPDRNFYCAITDSSGGFQFSLPDQTGKVEIFGSAEHQEIDELNLRIDQNFTNEFIALPYLVLQDDSAILDVYNKLSVNAQIAEQFKSDLKENNGIHSTGKDRDSVRVYFYGRPSKVILIENFIKLPTLEDYFNEVIPEVAIRKRNNKKKFVIHGNNAELNLFDPLVMIDGVAIFDIDAVLKISPRHIVRVEVITEPYIRGNVVFGGIINIISKEDNFGYVELPSSGLLFEFKMFSYNGQSGIIRNGITRHIPDVRNTLYWKGNLVLTDSSAHHFQANDVSGVYEIMLMGFTKNGEYIESTETFSVE